MQRTETLSGHAPAYDNPGESTRSAVSWGAVIAGAVIAAALTATLTIGGAGLGLLAVSPWQNEGTSGITIAVGTIVWLFLTHIISYGITESPRPRTKPDSRGP